MDYSHRSVLPADSTPSDSEQRHFDIPSLPRDPHRLSVAPPPTHARQRSRTHQAYTSGEAESRGTWMDFLRDSGLDTTHTVDQRAAANPGSEESLGVEIINSRDNLRAVLNIASSIRTRTSSPTPHEDRRRGTGGQESSGTSSSLPVPSPSSPIQRLQRLTNQLQAVTRGTQLGRAGAQIDWEQTDNPRKRRLAETARAEEQDLQRGRGTLRRSLAARPLSRPRMSDPERTVIDLTSSPDAERDTDAGPVIPTRRQSSGSHPGVQRHARSSHGGSINSTERRPSELSVPTWQADSDVSHCPVCERQFTMLYRRHHCRKCGRVVCANCSPHRITLPRQFIVHPPASLFDSELSGSPLGPNNTINSALGGGEEVRVCNPCVPGLIYGGVPLYESLHPYQPSLLQNYMQSDPFWDSQPSVQRGADDGSPPRLHQGFTSFDQLNNQPSSVMLGPPVQRDRPGFYTDVPARYGYVSSHPQQISQLPPGHLPPGSPPPRPFLYGNHLVNPRTSSHSHRPHLSADSYPTPLPQHRNYQHLPDGISHPLTSAPLVPIPPRGVRLPPDQAPRPARREIAEEDECPVCGNELPPRGADGEETERERHVEECIAGHFVGSASGSSNRLGAAAAATDSAPKSLAGASSSSAPQPASALAGLDPVGRARAGTSATPVGSPGDVPRRRATGNRMLVYVATENDAVGEGGEPAECIICLEEFQSGERMGRLNCWCTFHKTCITSWWATKGIGSCPTHQLHD